MKEKRTSVVSFYHVIYNLSINKFDTLWRTKKSRKEVAVMLMSLASVRSQYS